jgi:2-dehydropantoate 2-reductase
MPQSPKRILVLGAGVIGSVYAAWLQRAGQQVTMLARGQRLVEVQEQGLLIEDTRTRQRLSVPIATVDHLAPDDAYDLLIVAVRLDQVPDLLPLIAATTAIPTVLFLLNNAFGVEQFATAVGHDRAVIGFPGIGGRRDGATVKYYVLPQQPTTLGEVGGQLTPRLQMLAALITATGHRVTLTTRIDAWLKTHAVFVTCLAAAINQCGGDSVRLAQDRQQVATMVQAIREGFRALQALGLPVTPQNLAVLFGWMPRWFAVRYWQRTLQGPVGTLAIGPHARAARGEMAALAVQVLTLLRPSSLSTQTLRRLLATLSAPPVG